MKNICITGCGSISSLGNSREEILENYLAQKPLFSMREDAQKNPTYIAQLSAVSKDRIETLKNSNIKYAALDDSVLFAMFSARKALKDAGWADGKFGVNIGSSRGATGLFEAYHEEFIQTQKTSTLASPTTTLGNISSWVLQDLAAEGPEISHSITCSTALHSVLNGIAWMRAQMAEKFLVGGSEAPLTPFTIAQMKALKLYARPTEDGYPNKSMLFSKTENTMILGEAACTFAMEEDRGQKRLAQILGYGYGSENLTHNISISEDAFCLQKSMKMALKNANLEHVDAIVLHAPGTKKGDTSELKAIAKVFQKQQPLLTSNKYLIGHTFGASGAMSLEMALLMIENGVFLDNPLFNNSAQNNKIETVMVNAVGFGGNAVSIIIGK